MRWNRSESRGGGAHAICRKDVDKVRPHPGIAAPALARPRPNAAGRPRYSAFYRAETREIVAEQCRPDIECFG
jgi:hypothetical protein